MSGLATTLLLCLTQVLALSGSLTFQALIPQLIERWSLSNAEAGWIASITYVAYAVAAPVLVALTDRIDARRIVIGSVLLSAIASAGFALTADGFWSALGWRLLAGVGVAGSYMPGLKALTDRVEGPSQGRFQSFYTASYSLGSGFSMLQAGLLADLFGLRGAFLGSAVLTLPALAILWLALPARAPAAQHARSGLLAFGPILRHRPTLGFIIAYAGHAWELFAFRTWIVAFLTALPAMTWGTASIATIATVMITLGLPASILGNEIATLLDRRRSLIAMMLLSGVAAMLLGMLGSGPLPLVIGILAIYALLVMSDSAAITVGTLACAPAERRGATIAVQTLIASLMAMISPLACGWSLDLLEGDGRLGWLVVMAIMGSGAVFGAIGLALIGGSGRDATTKE